MAIPKSAKRKQKQDRNYALIKLSGAVTKTSLGRQQRWAEWVKQLNVPTEHEIPRNMYIKPQIWTKITQGNTRQGAQCIAE